MSQGGSYTNVVKRMAAGVLLSGGHYSKSKATHDIMHLPFITKDTYYTLIKQLTSIIHSICDNSTMEAIARQCGTYQVFASD
jgi:hypothetical protein